MLSKGRMPWNFFPWMNEPFLVSPAIDGKPRSAPPSAVIKKEPPAKAGGIQAPSHRDDLPVTRVKPRSPRVSFSTSLRFRRKMGFVGFPKARSDASRSFSLSAGLGNDSRTQPGRSRCRKAAPRFNQVSAATPCVKADIRFPVDWVLLRDATRPLVQVIFQNCGEV
jgi:hypothetical protein